MSNAQHPEALDAAKQEAFVGKVLSDTSAAMTTALASIGDHLGLFKDLATHGPSTSIELAARTDTNERYIREWLGGMATAGYIDYDPALRPVHPSTRTRSGTGERKWAVFLRWHLSDVSFHEHGS